MRFSANRNNPMPPAELRCIWMTAGVLSYQLCDRQFDCEECPLDRAMRMHFTRGASAAPRPHDETPPAASLFSRNHFQVTPVDASCVRAELEARLAALLPPVKSVVLPAAGDVLDEHAPAAWLVFDDGTLPLVSPVGGRVVRTNEELRAHPHLVASPLSVERWLFEIAPAAPAAYAAALSTRDDIAALYEEDDLRFRALVEAQVNRSSAEAGPTLADGGKRLDSVIGMVGARKYCELLVLAYTQHAQPKKK